MQYKITSEMELFKKIFSTKKVMYPELKPADRIRKVIEVHIFPDLEKLGFKMHKSTLSITRKVGDFKQEMHFQKNKWNQGNETVGFSLIFNVSFPKYLKWHLSNYGAEPMNDGVAGTTVWGMKDWPVDFSSSSWYDLAAENNIKLVEAVKHNILTIGLDYFDSYSTKEKAIETTIASRSYYAMCPLLFDLALILDNKNLAETVIFWFDDFVSKEKAVFNENTLKDVELRKEKLKEWL